jgi:hypothetical protein
MTTCPWEEIDEFQSPSEFDRFIEWMNAQTKLRSAEEVPVQRPYIGATTFTEKWFRHLPSGDTWRLVWPDAPFKGLFEPVDR